MRCFPFSTCAVFRRFSGSAERACGQGRAEPVALGDHAADRRVERRLQALAKARSFGASLCLCVGGRGLSAGAVCDRCEVIGGEAVVAHNLIFRVWQRHQMVPLPSRHRYPRWALFIPSQTSCLTLS